MAPSKPIQLRVTAEIRAAIEAYCAEHGVEMSDLIRDAVLKKIGRRDLIGSMPSRGKPPKTE